METVGRMGAMALPILLDIGHSIDDFFAVALAATSSELDLLGVTTGRDGCGSRARVVRQLLDAYGRSDVPVGAGEGTGRHRDFFVGFVERQPAGRRGQRGWQPAPAVELMQRVIDGRSDVTLACTGPLTNAVALFRRNPAATKRVRHLYFVGGWITQGLPEHNVRLDAEAAARLLRYDVPITAFGYEVTRGYRLFRPHRARLDSGSSAGARYLSELYRAWCEYIQNDAPGMLDPLLIAYLAGHLPTRFAPVRVGVVTSGPGRGTVFRDDVNGREIQVVTKVDGARYVDFLVARVAQIAPMGDEVDPYHWQPALRGAYHLEHYAGWALNRTVYTAHTLAFIEAGTCRVEAGGDVVTLERGDVLYVPPDRPVAVHTETGVKANWLTFDIIVEDWAQTMQPLDRLPWPARFRSSTEAAVWSGIAERIVTYWWRPVSEARLLYQAAFLELLARLHAWARDEGALSLDRTQEAVMKARRWIEAHADRPVTLDEVARAAALSKYHLIRVFKEAIGVPPLQYHRQLRLQLARRLLEVPHVPIAEVAARVGYTSTTSFTKAFKKEYGIAPSEMRRSV